jgi:tetratricopeptide (TPR) repeat protein
MTDVYLAIDTVENRKAALKLIKQGDDTVTRLMLEAERRGAAIQKELRVLDPRVVEIYDYGDLDGYFFVAMQYVEGRNLAEVLATERVIDPVRAAMVALEICEQLAKFHSWQSAVVHGDIKPSNIHLGPNDTVRLLDFGIAKMLRANCDATIHNFGSPSYCSPERLTRSQVDQQSDLWAVGATLYEMQAGVPPYQAENTRKLESLIRSKRPPRALPATCPRPLRAIVTKALAPNPARRYPSARELQADLQSFLEQKPTVAELERRSIWGANATATLEAARAALRRATRTARMARLPHPVLQAAGAVAWFAAGMALWIGGTYAWEGVQARRATIHPVPAPAPIVVSQQPKIDLASLYLSEGDGILESYRKSADPSLHDFDWQKAEICLRRAVEMGRADDRTLGELALSSGYGALERLSGGQYSEAAADQLRLEARRQFALAAQKMPRTPDPHLALARLFVYSLPNVDRAMEEFQRAEHLGASMGSREIEQQADAYRLRALQEWPAESQAAVRDAQAARRLYARIPDFDQAGRHLKELTRIHPLPARRPSRRLARRTRWP